MLDLKLEYYSTKHLRLNLFMLCVFSYSSLTLHSLHIGPPGQI